MALDVHKLESGRIGKHLLSINDLEYYDLEPAIEHYKSKTGLLIDQYSDFKLTSGTQALIKSLEETNNNSEIYTKLISALKHSELMGYSIIFVGD